MTTQSRHQAWPDFQALVQSGHPAIVVVPGTPRTIFFTDADGTRIGVRVHSSEDVPELRLREICTAAVSFDGARYLELATDHSNVYQEFYAFACTFADRVQVGGESATAALVNSLESWNKLLAEAPDLSVTEQTGLYGELWVLKRLSKSLGWPKALNCWKGPSGEEHDFSLIEMDIEVKTTTQERRIHTIRFPTQLEASHGRSLFLLSLMFTAGGISGTSIGTAISYIRALLSEDLLVVFEEKLSAVGWKAKHDSAHSTRYLMRTSPTMIQVDDHFPRIPPHLDFLDASTRSRLSRLTYDIDVDGLGFQDGTSEFLRLLPDSEA